MLIFKNSFKKILKSLGRFFSLIFIIALGSAFFSGLRETSSDMIKTMDHYYDEYHLMDFRVVSTMGLTDDDVASLQGLANVSVVEPAYSFETVVDGYATKVYSITDEVNQVHLIEGRMPENANEILVEVGTYSLGDTVTFESDSLDYISNQSFTVVGLIESPMYIYNSKGISTVGSGKLDTFMYILKDNFTLEAYTEVYILAKDNLTTTAYMDDYENQVLLLNAELQNLRPIRETARYEELFEEAMNEVYKAQDELNEEKSKGEKEFQDAWNEILENEKSIQNGWIEYNNGYATLNETKANMESTFASTRSQLEASESALSESLQSFNLTYEEIPNAIATANTQIASLRAMLEGLEEGSEEYLALSKQITALQSYSEGLSKILEAKQEIDNGYASLNDGIATWNQEYQSGLNSLRSSYQQLVDAEAQLENGKKEYEANYQTFTTEINDALKEIDDAREEVLNMEKPVWYLFDREDNSGYTTFYDTATKVDAIATVFPVFFIIVALLMCLNTMTRMIEEERSEIGLFTSLGYSKGKIVASYIFYVLIASTIGLLLGLSIGYFVVPIIIYQVYSASFTISNLITVLNVPVSLIIIFVCYFIMSFVTYLTLYRDFKIMPANLLRPEAPKMGKRVFLEKIGFLWKWLSFTWKVTVRNLFRYKKRIIMTLIGITGCTALLLTGFGIQDSISSLMDKQFGSIQVYDAVVMLDEELQEESSEVNTLLANNDITEKGYINMQNYTFEVNKKNLDIYVMAFEDANNIEQFVHLKDLDGNPISITDNGVILTQKTAELLGVDVGDTFSIRNSENSLFVLKVNGITENYVNHYIYMNMNYYNQIMGETSYNALILNMDGEAEDVGNHLMESGLFSGIQYSSDTMEMFEDVINSLNNIVFLVIGFSTFLAITVLYNLTTINISERTREIATLKVLGFHDREVSSYVYRETMLLTIVGILVGFGFGVLLNYFVMTVAETDEILFLKIVDPISYLYAFLIMVIFTVIVQVVTHFILKIINMIDSLKSVE